MASKINVPLFYFFSIAIPYSCVIEQPIAFTIKLIHRYAPESPFYNPSLTYHEIVERQSNQTRSHEMENGTLLDVQTIRPHLRFIDSVYIVKVSLGTFSSSRGISHKSYYLVLDTGSTITWLQCEDCKKSGHQCYRQLEPPFPNSKSGSYQPLSYEVGSHPLCIPYEFIGHFCSYDVRYADGDYSTGILAHEKFAFPSSTGHEKIIPLVFGCGIDNYFSNIAHRRLEIAGVLGLGWGPHSFVTQTNSISHGRFSYCFPPGIQAARGSPAFLRFGSDIPSYSTLPGTRLLRYRGEKPYFVNLLDIAINGTRLNIPSHYFRRGGPNGRGTIFDTGNAVTRISAPAYRMVKRAVKRHISRYVTSLEIVGRMFGEDLCYQAFKPFRQQSNLPSITFHFEGNAQLGVKPDIAFDIISLDGPDRRYEHVCLQLMPQYSPKMTSIGCNLQANQLIVYDVTGRRMYFGPRDCSQDN